jgi:RNA recognition motif. (a.k.a. RRM, RBD, or RNP domain)
LHMPSRNTPFWSGPPGPNPFIAPALPPIAPPQPPHNFNMWPFSGPLEMDVVPRVQTASPPIMTAPTPTLAPEPSPPPPYSALPPIPEIERQEGLTVTIDTDTPETPSDPCNLFVKNLDDEVIVTQRDLENLFTEFGTITSAFLATYAPKDSYTPAVSKGFGFVAFSRPQEADIAKEKLHGIVIGRKKIFVNYAEKKEDRQMRLKVLFANVERLAEEMRSETATKRGEEMMGEVKRDERDDRVSRRGMLRGGALHDGSTMDIVPLIPRPTPSSSLV